MGGAIESMALRLIPLLARIPGCQQLTEKAEREVASAHCWFHCATCLVMGLVLQGWFATLLGCCGVYSLVIIAEANTTGRLIDWITRSAGWMIGTVITLLVSGIHSW